MQTIRAAEPGGLAQDDETDTQHWLTARAHTTPHHTTQHNTFSTMLTHTSQSHPLSLSTRAALGCASVCIFMQWRDGRTD
mmetsp:Transcript_24011/g.69196  ORF Transcript_24011/g.69196 Transcript_24011/m.69196 type:complete len:80 (+) Transcript_24011:601-840(+)